MSNGESTKGELKRPAKVRWISLPRVGLGSTRANRRDGLCQRAHLYWEPNEFIRLRFEVIANTIRLVLSWIVLEFCRP